MTPNPMMTPRVEIDQNNKIQQNQNAGRFADKYT